MLGIEINCIIVPLSRFLNVCHANTSIDEAMIFLKVYLTCPPRRFIFIKQKHENV